MIQTAIDVPALLTTVQERLAEFDVRGGMDALVAGLDVLRRTMPRDEWRQVVERDCRAHPVRALVHEGPITRRSVARPRGYAGDAGTLDLIYGCGALPRELSPLGAALYGYELQMSAAVSVRERRELLAALIDRVSTETPEPRVLSVACGHLREAERASALQAHRVAAFHALDQDALSLELVARTHGALGVRPVHGSVRSLLAGATRFADLDLVYAAGLYDYLDAPVAARLTATLFGMLRPGGRLLVANFARSLEDAAYMEAFMDWTLVYRDEDEVAGFAAEIPASEIAERRLYLDEPGNVYYLELRRS